MHDKGYEGPVMGAYTVELADDMLTVKTEPCLVAPSHLEAKGTDFWEHSFYEGSSIRKIDDTYYFIYSSHVNHELCYATSEYPDRDFQYRGVIISNGDVGYQGRKPKDRLNTTGNNHGSIVRLDGQWYIFYHRHTHNTSFSRQACAEKIEIQPDGTIPQTEMTSCGLNAGPLKTDGTYFAAICCGLRCGRMRHIVNGISRTDRPFITHETGARFITGIRNNTVISYKYFIFQGKTRITLTVRGSANGRMELLVGEKKLGEVTITPGKDWMAHSADIAFEGVAALHFRYLGRGRCDLLSFTFEEQTT